MEISVRGEILRCVYLFVCVLVTRTMKGCDDRDQKRDRFAPFPHLAVGIHLEQPGGVAPRSWR